MENILQYYNNYDEEHRLNRDNAHRLEQITSTRYLKKILPPKAKVLDCCAGTGYYSFWLAEQGHQVTAGDIVPKHVDIMKSSDKAKHLDGIYLGNVLDMTRFKDESFDAVLCMGAYYHLLDQEKRDKCIQECLRVLKKEGILVVSYINKNAVFLNHFGSNPSQIFEYLDIMKNGIDGEFYGVSGEEINRLAEQFAWSVLFEKNIIKE